MLDPKKKKRRRIWTNHITQLHIDIRLNKDPKLGREGAIIFSLYKFNLDIHTITYEVIQGKCFDCPSFNIQNFSTHLAFVSLKF